MGVSKTITELIARTFGSAVEEEGAIQFRRPGFLKSLFSRATGARGASAVERDAIQFSGAKGSSGFPFTIDRTPLSQEIAAAADDAAHSIQFNPTPSLSRSFEIEGMEAIKPTIPAGKRGSAEWLSARQARGIEKQRAVNGARRAESINVSEYYKAHGRMPGKPVTGVTSEQASLERIGNNIRSGKLEQKFKEESQLDYLKRIRTARNTASKPATENSAAARQERRRAKAAMRGQAQLGKPANGRSTASPARPGKKARDPEVTKARWQASRTKVNKGKTAKGGLLQNYFGKTGAWAGRHLNRWGTSLQKNSTWKELGQGMVAHSKRLSNPVTGGRNTLLTAYAGYAGYSMLMPGDQPLAIG